LLCRFDVEWETLGPEGFILALDMPSALFSKFSVWRVAGRMGIFAGGDLSVGGEVGEIGDACIKRPRDVVRHGGLYCGTRAENTFVGVVGDGIADDVEGDLTGLAVLVRKSEVSDRTSWRGGGLCRSESWGIPSSPSVEVIWEFPICVTMATEFANMLPALRRTLVVNEAI
jgi:hypothetical protein